MKRNFVYALLLALTASPFAPVWAETKPSLVGQDFLYQIQPKDTIYALSHSLLDTPAKWDAVVAYNHIRNPKQLAPGSQIKIPLAWLKGTPVSATVVTSRGATRNGASLQSGDAVNEGDLLTTKVDGSLVLRLPDGSQVLLQGGSTVGLDKLRQRPSAGLSSKLKLQEGRLETHANPSKVPGTSMEVQTPLSIAGVRGTQLRVAMDAAGQKASGEVTEGLVAYQGKQQSVMLPAGFGSQVAANGLPSKPVPLLNAPVLFMPEKAFERILFSINWQVVDRAAAYRVMIAKDEAFSDVVQSTLATTPPVKITNLDDGPYWVQVRAVDANGLEGMDSKAFFNLKARPEPPFVLTPKLVAKTTEGAAKFEWSQPEGVSAYHLQVADSPSFDHLIVDQTLAKQSSYTADLKVGQYYWRLASIRTLANGVDQGPYSDLGQLLVRPVPAVPPKPVETLDSLSFNWQGDTDQQFEVQLSDDKSFAEIKQAFKVAKPTLVIPRPDAGEWFVRIKAIDPDGFESAFSKPQKFVIYRRLVTSDGKPVLSSNGEPISAPTH